MLEDLTCRDRPRIKVVGSLLNLSSVLRLAWVFSGALAFVDPALLLAPALMTVVVSLTQQVATWSLGTEDGDLIARDQLGHERRRVPVAAVRHVTLRLTDGGGTELAVQLYELNRICWRLDGECGSTEHLRAALAPLVIADDRSMQLRTRLSTTLGLSAWALSYGLWLLLGEPYASCWGGFITAVGSYLALRWGVGLALYRRIQPCTDDDGQIRWLEPAVALATCLVWPVWTTDYPPWLGILAWPLLAGGFIVSELTCRAISRRRTPAPSSHHDR